LLDGLDDGFFLFIEMVMLIKKIPVFNHIQGKVLSDLADKIIPITLKVGEPNESLLSPMRNAHINYGSWRGY
jgi:hypothetical protein